MVRGHDRLGIVYLTKHDSGRHSARQASADTVTVTREEFERAYQVWRAQLDAESWDGVIWADSGSGRLFQVLLRHMSG